MMKKNKKSKIDIDLLVKVTSIQSSYSEDVEINKFIEKHLKGIEGVSVSKDAFGNIYGVKGEGPNGYKCIVAHTDTVHSLYNNRKIYIHDDILFAMASSEPVRKTSHTSPLTQVGIGGDDKAGVYAALKAMEDFDNIKSVFFRFEESGCRGSRASEMKFFDDCNFVVQLDRKGSSDFITHTNGIKVASAEFEKEMETVYKKFGFSSVIGVSTDVGALKSRGLPVSACNVSSGYYDPHSKFEVIDTNALQNSYEMISSMFDTYGDRRFEHEYVPVVYTRTEGRYASTFPRRELDLFSQNYFKKALESVNVQFYELTGLKVPKRMILVPPIPNWPNMYRFLGNDMIDLDVKCPECNSDDSVCYLTEDKGFMCSSSNHSDWIEDQKLYEKVKLEEDGIAYVYARVYDLWLDINDAFWDSDIMSYSPKVD